MPLEGFCLASHTHFLENSMANSTTSTESYNAEITAFESFHIDGGYQDFYYENLGLDPDSIEYKEALDKAISEWTENFVNTSLM